MSDDGRRIPALDALEPADRADASEARRYVRANFDAMTAARGRGVSWQQITDTMTAAGARAENGDPLTWRQLKSLFHTERYARGGKRKRRSAKPKARRPEAPAPAPELAGAPSAARRPKVEEDAGPASSAPAPEAADLRALLARRRPALSEPAPVTLGPEDRRPHQEKDDDG